MSELPDWITESAPVAEYMRGGFHRSSVAVTRVERLTATQIVLANGSRYRRDTLRLVGDHYAGELLPLSDQRVRDARATRRLASLRSEIDAAVRNVKDTEAGVREAVAAIEAAVRRVVDAMDRADNAPESNEG